MFRNISSVVALLIACSGLAKGEVIELTNGETLSGNVVSMDAEKLEVKTSDNETRTIQRDKIAQITFVERKPASRRFSIASMLRELRAEGIDEESWAELQKRIRVMETPELKRYFNDTIAGLRDDMQNLQKDAREVEGEIRELQKEYGPQADTLNDYLMALRGVFSTTTETDAADDGEPQSEESTEGSPQAEPAAPPSDKHQESAGEHKSKQADR